MARDTGSLCVRSQKDVRVQVYANLSWTITGGID